MHVLFYFMKLPTFFIAKPILMEDYALNRRKKKKIGVMTIA
jgi:hypothetical protein